MSLAANALTTGSILELRSNSAALNSGNGLLYVTNNNTSTSGNLARFNSNATAGAGLTIKTSGFNGFGTSAPLSPLSISKQDQIAAPATDVVLHVSGTDGGTNSGIQLDLHNSGANGPLFFGRHARGVASTPTATQSGDILAYFSGAGYGTSAYSALLGGVELRAGQNFTNTAQGTALSLFTVANGGVTRTERLLIDNTATYLFHGATKTEFNSGVMKLWDGNATNFIGIQPPATGVLVADYTLTLPADDGAANQTLITNGSGTLSWVTPGRNSVEDFAASGTYTVPAGAIAIEITCVGGGGGGGSGRKRVAGSLGTGGGGGSAGAVSFGSFSITALGSPGTITVTVGAGGAGGASQAANSTNGNGGVAGGESSCSISGTTFIRASGGNLGVGGNNAGAGGGAAAAFGDFIGFGGGNAAGGAGVAPIPVANKAPGSAGGGGSVTAANATNAGGAGGAGYYSLVAGGAAGAAAADGTAGTAIALDQITGGGGGGGGSKTAAGGNAGAGGGGARGAGGGGGGAGTDANCNSGAGGAGGNGLVRIIAHY